MKIYAIATVLSLGLAIPGCSKSDDKADKAPAPAAKAPTDEAPATPTPPADDGAAAVAAIDAVMAPYEQCRELLAADKGAGVADCAKAMAAAANAGAPAVGDDARPHMTAVAAAASKLAEVSADDLDALRLSFGEVSKPLVAALTATPKAAAKYHVFECPMAKGYKRWAQPTAEMANPYMGTAMLACGSEVHDHHKGTMEGGEHGDMDDMQHGN